MSPLLNKVECFAYADAQIFFWSLRLSRANWPKPTSIDAWYLDLVAEPNKIGLRLKDFCLTMSSTYHHCLSLENLSMVFKWPITLWSFLRTTLHCPLTCLWSNFCFCLKQIATSLLNRFEARWAYSGHNRSRCWSILELKMALGSP